MDFELTDEQRQLQDSVAKFVSDNYSFEQRRALVATDAGFSDDNWSQMAELGWLALSIPEDNGGIGLGAVETMILM